MNRDKRLFNFMIKVHPAIVGWFIHKNVVGKNDDKLYIVEGKNEDDELTAAKLPEVNDYVVYKTDREGVRIIDASTQDHNFSEIILNYTRRNRSFRPLVEAGFPIFQFEHNSDTYCFTHHIEGIINNFTDWVLDIDIPYGLNRFKGKSIEKYMEFIQNQIDFETNNDSPFWRSIRFYHGQARYSNQISEKNNNINRNLIFTYKEIYRVLEWDLDLVERYKDQIMWRELINMSNLTWSDEMLSKYDDYIPYCRKNEDTYCEKFKDKLNYGKFGFLGNRFLDSHKDVLDWSKVFEECKFDWSDKEMTYFSDYVMSINMPYSEWNNETAASQLQFSHSDLLSNKYFNWTPNNLLAFLLSNNNNWRELISVFRPELYKIFLSIPNIKVIAEPYVKDIKNFWDIVNNTHPYPYDELAKEFTIERIRDNIKEWSNVIEEKFIDMRRTPDTNYHFYAVITQWDIYKKRNNIPLTYELAKYLSTIDITLGGEYMDSDGGYIEEDNRFPIINGLEAFSSHHIDTKKDIEKILEDEKIAYTLLDYNNRINLDLLYYAIETFFKDYPLKDYISIVNQLKDWDAVEDYSSNAEKDNSFNDEDWNRVRNSIMINDN